MAKKKEKKKADTEETKEEGTAKKGKKWEIRENDFMRALKETIDEGGNKDDLRDKVVEYSKKYNPRKAGSNCTKAKINFQHRKAKKLTGKELYVAPSGSLSAEQKIAWKDAFADYK